VRDGVNRQERPGSWGNHRLMIATDTRACRPIILDGTVASGDHSNRRPPPEPLNAIGDAGIDCFEHF
jgi:hypothetical protein